MVCLQTSGLLEKMRPLCPSGTFLWERRDQAPPCPPLQVHLHCPMMLPDLINVGRHTLNPKLLG